MAHSSVRAINDEDLLRFSAWPRMVEGTSYSARIYWGPEGGRGWSTAPWCAAKPLLPALYYYYSMKYEYEAR